MASMSNRQRKAMFARFYRYGLVSAYTRDHSSTIPTRTIRLLEARARFIERFRKPKFERCVKSLKPKANGVNPYAVCRSSTRYYGSTRHHAK